ncbi:MAG TPA: HAD family phosphatase [Mycobacteriales bacterium]|nr:HAD family phosphatase [Mycobacteriales bacterium]
MLAGAIFDLDGVLADTEHLWEESWQAYLGGAGVTWKDEFSPAMQGMSSPEWAGYLAGRAGRPEDADGARRRCIQHVVAAIDAGRGPLLPGARELIEAVGQRLPLGLASSAAREVIDRVLSSNDIADRFHATVSSEEVARGKPAPDVYLEAVRRVGFSGPGLAFEDSSNGIRSAHAAGLYVIAIPNPQYPPAPDALALADHVASGHDDARVHALARLH